MHVGDTIFIFCLALIIFGPKKLPEIGRQIGKLMVEFRRASNEFKMQIEEELRASEEAERQKEITAANTMLPSAAATTGAALIEAAASSSNVNGSYIESANTTPVIAPPSTGVPVNHTFASVESTTTQAAEADAPAFTESYPERANGFNPGLNSASNGEVAEIPAENATPPHFPTETFEPKGSLSPGEAASEDPQAAVHHG